MSLATVISIIEHRFKLLEESLLKYDQIERSKSDDDIPDRTMFIYKKPQNNSIECISHAWDVVDWLDRLRKLFGAVSGVKKKDEWYVEAMKVLKTTSETRNFLQHYDSELKYFIENKAALLGNVIANYQSDQGWYLRSITSSYSYGLDQEEYSIPGFNIPDKVSKPIESITLSIAETNFNISKTIEAMRPCIEEYKTSMLHKYGFVWPSFNS